MTGAYYNEFDPYAAQWLRNLITAGHIAPGEVDERSIKDVHADDLKGFVQCHFFAGIGVWSHALRKSGWDDSRPVWTGSCPCQPFSAAGAGAGTTDERHLWPAFFKLIDQRRPAVVFGEQVEAAIRHGWLDLVQADMEGIGYAFAATGIPAAGVGAPHIRQRLWFVADNNIVGQQPLTGEGLRIHTKHDAKPFSLFSRLGNNNNNKGLEGHRQPGQLDATQGRQDAPRHGSEAGVFSVPAKPRSGRFSQEGWREIGRDGQSGISEEPRPAGPTNGHWRDADWLFCRDGKWRAVEPGSKPLAHGITNRVGRLRAYGNAIVADVAKEFITAFMSVRP